MKIATLMAETTITSNTKSMQSQLPCTPATATATATPQPGAPLIAPTAPTPTPIAPTVPVAPSVSSAPIPVSAQTATAIPQNPPAIPVQTAPQTYTVQELGLAARPLVEMGRQADLMQLLAEFGAPSVADLPENQRAAFAARLRAMGGQI
ncbi:hypothetical protein [uncultured Ruminococcus sp.]|uniref:hypothetical protein n=1 Tax=uncultured Ruminococcus sp. TaxID=165186 RepID=UPI0025EEA8A8|nr:hypothetical protein [uncultured Ruminococcus sp.]